MPSRHRKNSNGIDEASHTQRNHWTDSLPPDLTLPNLDILSSKKKHGELSNSLFDDK